MSFQGIPIRLVPTNPETHEPESNFETAVFATVRRCPKLLQLLQDFARADVAEDGARTKAVLARRKLLDAETPEAVDAAQADAQAQTMAAEEAGATLCNVIHDFLVTGFKGAGYADDQAERYADMVPSDRLRELKAAALVGTGRLDFTKAPASP